MSRARQWVPNPLDAAASGAFSAAVAGFWTGKILAALAGLLWDRARFLALLAMVDALSAAGRADLAGAVCEREAARAERRRRLR